jgi:hypothetical protein
MKEAEVWHDCTGSYLKQPGGDLKVCNKEIIEEFSSGEFIEVTYTISSDRNCTSVNDYVCKLWHPYSEVIEIEKVNHK